MQIYPLKVDMQALGKIRLPSLLLLLLPITAGCGTNGSEIGTQVSPPVITVQPASVTVPLGSVATFAVSATGSEPLCYQWRRDGKLIAGATSSSYVISSVGTSDDSSGYDVTVSNDSATAISKRAVLSVGARSPKAGDLRFQQIGAATTVNGYGGGFAINMLPGQQWHFSDQIGIPLSVGPGCGGIQHVFDNCGWIIETFDVPVWAGLSVNYGSYQYAERNTKLAELADSRTVVTGMDIAPLYGSFAVSWARTTRDEGFDAHLRTVTLAQLGSAAAEEAAQGRVITAVSFDSGQVTYLAYRWTDDPTTLYESTAVDTSKTNAGATAVAMASQGYIITAIGGNDIDGVIIIGTRVKGDSLPREIVIIPGGQPPQLIADQGYAPVAIIYTAAAGFIAWIRER